MSMNCTSCGMKLSSGKFAYEQDVCWCCFKKEVDDISYCIEHFYPSWEWDKQSIHKDILNWMLRCIAEIYNEKA